MTDTFAGIRPIDVPLFITAQLFGALGATLLFRWLVPGLDREARDVLLAHGSEIANTEISEGAAR
jgi:hypothetical protein